MRTWQMHELGDPWTDLQLDEAEAPTPGPGQIGIDVEAVGVAFPNVLMAQGKYQVKSTPPFSPAESVVGRVSSLGEGVDSFSIGDRVMTGDGVALAEHTVASAKRAFLAPESLTPGQSTALLVNYPTTLFGLYERAQLKEGETVLITAAAGGVGTAAIDLAKARGATVIAVAGGPEKLQVCKDVGADFTVDYRATPDFVDEVREISGGGVDVCYEVVGGDTFQHARRCMGWDGRLLIIGFAGGTIPDSPMNHALLKNYSIVGVHWGASIQRDPSSLGRQLDELTQLADAGKISPAMYPPFAFEDAKQAFDDLAHRKTTGKVVVEL
ncbi:NADPH:quinone oxidoreductase family protein [bacterium]|jgi:NADPH:quinone reductase|nr:NADPH:quinone oxidoreductase family protein [bacterium]MDB4103718.1 NADPH:quinone oxidoreductase family protein [Acidimicrobiales bacterium]